jgi:ATP-binding cassette subfamily C (CFTR/MRP) protein 4
MVVLSNGWGKKSNSDSRVNLEQKISNFSLYNETTEESESELATERDYVLYLLAAMIILTTVFNLGRTFGFYTVMRRASINIHKHMITNVMNATMQFFDSNFIGNILNRFSKDLTVIDEHLPFIFHQVFRVNRGTDFFDNVVHHSDSRPSW